MGWALVTGQHANSHDGSGVGSITFQLPSNWTGGNKILIATNCWRSGNTGTITVTDSGSHTWVKLAAQRTASDNGEVALWSCDFASTPGANQAGSSTYSRYRSVALSTSLTLSGIRITGRRVTTCRRTFRGRLITPGGYPAS